VQAVVEVDALRPGARPVMLPATYHLT
jgi:hypothetical protein